MPSAIPQEPGTEQVHDVAREHRALLAEWRIRVREIGAKQLVVVLDPRAQQQRPPIVQPQAESREVPGPFVIQPLLAGAERADVAGQIEEREGVAVLQDRAAIAGARRRGEDVELILNLDQIFHHTPTPASACVSPAGGR